MIKDDLEKQQLLPRDIMIIDMDTYDYSKNYMRLNNIQSNINSDAAYDDNHRIKYFVSDGGTGEFGGVFFEGVD